MTAFPLVTSTAEEKTILFLKVKTNQVSKSAVSQVAT